MNDLNKRSQALHRTVGFIKLIDSMITKISLLLLEELMSYCLKQHILVTVSIQLFHVTWAALWNRKSGEGYSKQRRHLLLSTYFLWFSYNLKMPPIWK